MDVIASSENRMKKTIETIKADMAKIRGGRAHPSFLSGVMVSCYDTQMPLEQTSSVSVADAQTLAVIPWDKQNLQAIEKAIRTSDLGVNPATEGEKIHVSLPQLSEERRRELIKVVKKEIESAKVAIRNIRRDGNSEIKDALKAHEIGEDEAKRLEDSLQQLTDRNIGEIDSISTEKSQELLKIA